MRLSIFSIAFLDILPPDVEIGSPQIHGGAILQPPMAESQKPFFLLRGLGVSWHYHRHRTDLALCVHAADAAGLRHSRGPLRRVRPSGSVKMRPGGRGVIKLKSGEGLFIGGCS